MSVVEYKERGILLADPNSLKQITNWAPILDPIGVVGPIRSIWTRVTQVNSFSKYISRYYISSSVEIVRVIKQR